MRCLGQPLTIMTSQELLTDRINSLLYWAEELKCLIDTSEVDKIKYDDISWFSRIISERAKSVVEILKEDEFN